MDRLDVILILLIAGVLLLPPLILWRFKGFCERHPSTVPFRTVPLGCLTMLVVETVYVVAVSLLFPKISGRNPLLWMVLFAPIIELLLGIWVIARLSRLLTKGRESPPGCLYPLVFVGTALVCAGIYLIWSMRDLNNFDRKSEPWSTISLPAVQNCEIAFEQRSSHPFLAEYDYRIRLGKGRDKAYFWLWPNTGGRTFVNVYRVADDKLLLKDKNAAYLVDITRKQVYLVDNTHGYGPLEQEIHSAVPLSNKEFDCMGSGSVVFKDDTQSLAVPYDIDLSSCEYIGCIMDYSFYTPDQQPEGEGHPRYR